jgi:hypothetical protein
MAIRKPVLLIDDTENSKIARELLEDNQIEFVEYHVRRFEEDCCVDLPTTRAPALFAPEGLFRNLEGIKEYLTIEKQTLPLNLVKVPTGKLAGQNRFYCGHLISIF